MNSAAHWTYEDNIDPKSDLFQGDIIRPCDEISRILREIHPHFEDNKYTGFMILTQTCDLARRAGRYPSARYLNIAVIRPLKDVLFWLLDGACEPLMANGLPISGIYSEADRYKADQLIARIINQNEQKLGLFYLFPYADAFIAVDSVVLLQVSIALKAFHYDVFLKHRCGRLNAEFRSRLGWLTGNLFSRVAVRDWGDNTKVRATEMLDLISSKGNNKVHWVQQRKFKKTKKRLKKEQEQVPSRDEVVKIIDEQDIESRLDDVCTQIRKAITGVEENIEPEQVEKILRRLQNNPDFISHLRK